MGVCALANISTTVRTASNREIDRVFYRAAPDQLRQRWLGICRWSILLGVLTCGPGAFSRELRSPRGTTKGLFTADPTWGVGIQLGNYGATGLVAQKLGFYQGSLDLAFGTVDASAALSLDYVAHFSPDLKNISLPEAGPLQLLRGKMSPYLGGGLQVSRGVSLRLPVGIGYVMLKDPVQFYGGLSLTVGPYLTDSKSNPELWFNLGMRIFM